MRGSNSIAIRLVKYFHRDSTLVKIIIVDDLLEIFSNNLWVAVVG